MKCLYLNIRNNIREILLYYLYIKLKMNDIFEGDDYFNDKNYFHQEEQTQSFINNLKQNLSEKDLYTQLFNNYYKFEKIMQEKKSQDISMKNMVEKRDQKKLIDIEQKEQINEVKINMFMILFNECDDDSKKNEYPYIDNDYIMTRRLIIEDCKINENKLIVNKKDYVFIPIRNNPIFPYNKEMIKVETKNKLVSALKIDQKAAMNEEEFKELYKDQLTKEIEYLKENKKSTTKSNSGQNFSVKTDNSESEINGKRFYIKIDDNNIRRYIFTNDYKKQIDGFYTRHKEINLGIEGKVELKIKSDDNTLENYDYLIKDYNTTNNLMAHILFKNFNKKTIPKDEPIILEIKKSFKLYDLLNQIKQISKVAKNLTLNTAEDNNKISNFPKYIIGYLCNFRDTEVKKQNLKILNEKYKETDKTLLEHDLEIINKNDVKVVICLIKDEKIMGYDLSREDYNNIEGKEITKRVDLTYLCEKIFPKENKEDLINLTLKKYKEKFESLTYEKTIKISEYCKGIEKIKNEFKSEFEKLNDKNQEYKTEIERLNEENKRILDEYTKMKNKYEELKNSSQQKNNNLINSNE